MQGCTFFVMGFSFSNLDRIAKWFVSWSWNLLCCSLLESQRSCSFAFPYLWVLNVLPCKGANLVKTKPLIKRLLSTVVVCCRLLSDKLLVFIGKSNYPSVKVKRLVRPLGDHCPAFWPWPACPTRWRVGGPRWDYSTHILPPCEPKGLWGGILLHFSLYFSLFITLLYIFAFLIIWNKQPPHNE